MCFTGSNETARTIQRTLAERESGPIATLIAETGGQNAMFVDSSALPEQVVLDVVASSFNSAGQRCSALRVLFVQDDIADRTLEVLRAHVEQLGQMAERYGGLYATGKSLEGARVEPSGRAAELIKSVLMKTFDEVCRVSLEALRTDGPERARKILSKIDVLEPHELATLLAVPQNPNARYPLAAHEDALRVREHLALCRWYWCVLAVLQRRIQRQHEFEVHLRSQQFRRAQQRVYQPTNISS